MAKNLLEIFNILVPIKDLKPKNFRELARLVTLEEVAPGRPLFKPGETDKYTLYALSGEIILGGGAEAVTLAGGSEAARFPVGHNQPRHFSAIARTPATILRVDSAVLDMMLTWDQSAGCVVAEISTAGGADDDDWMTQMLQSRVFEKVPPMNIQSIFMRMEPAPVRAGQVIIKQGDEGDYYYVIRRGRARVTRKTTEQREVALAEIGVGDGFGEEALISNAPRNATVTMLSDGELMRLSKKDFVSLLTEPALKWVEFRAIPALLQQGAQWLDVRMEAEHRYSGIAGSINIPLAMLRIKAATLDPKRKYIVYCDTGSRSSAAAFLLGQRGFDVVVLKGGIGAARAPAA
ncbi:MAG: cyclic nucleotide-binding protein [Gammaproteobacteria bacterium]|nr:MAG: cyclic nucleotide-binding protein [Gammaproteobacteria bacterium]